ncbi:hypothetical protein JQ636_04635 [Bradyrhizobium japonicum]|uniref:hypothetical protein n=1 Tax=Bradyrhizobium japonicum TaxID=375 RepID=UPI001BA9D328|nr:hypothetical protein [Bradyrhizobium japonicum]MBR0802817.1 hypothetical protein [Bradyrhizobium japonicum]
MRTILITTICWALSCGFALAQAEPGKDLKTPTGRSAPEEKGQLQPQGWTGPLETKSGGAPPESPQAKAHLGCKQRRMDQQKQPWSPGSKSLFGPSDAQPSTGKPQCLNFNPG